MQLDDELIIILPQSETEEVWEQNYKVMSCTFQLSTFTHPFAIYSTSFTHC